MRPRLVEPSQVSNEIQAWTEIFEQKNNDRITKMREEMENKLDAILMEIKTSKSTSITTNPRSEMNEIENMQPSESKGKKSMGVNASDNESINSENEDIPLKASEMRDLRHPAKPIHQNDTTLDATVIFNEESDEEDYHNIEQKMPQKIRNSLREKFRNSSREKHTKNNFHGKRRRRLSILFKFDWCLKNDSLSGFKNIVFFVIKPLLECFSDIM